MLHDIQHPVTYRLSRLSLFSNAFAFYLDRYKAAQKQQQGSDSCFAGRRKADLLPQDLVVIGSPITDKEHRRVLDE